MWEITMEVGTFVLIILTAILAGAVGIVALMATSIDR
jgi:hypothetical protein